MSRVINKEQFKDVSLYNMMWEQQALQEVIKEKKNEQEQELLVDARDWIIEAINKDNFEKELTSILNHFMLGIRQVEREL